MNAVHTLDTAPALRAFLDSWTEPVVGVDVRARVSVLNDAARRLLAVDGDLLEGRPVAAILPDWSTTGPAPAGTAWRTTAHRTDGRAVAIEATCCRPATADGGPALWTLRPAGAEDAPPAASRQDAASRLAAIVESSRAAIVGYAPDGRITSWNPSAETVFGLPTGEAIGRDLVGLVGGPDAPAVTDAITRTVRGETVKRTECRCRRADGSWIDLSMIFSPVLDPQGTPTGGSVIARDVTEHSQVRRDLEQAERVAGLGCFRWSGPRSPRVWSAGMFAVMGFDPDAGVPGDEASMAGVHPDDRHRIEDLFAGVVAGTIERDETDFRLADGAGGWRVLHGIVARDHRSPLGAAFGIVQDVTTSRRREEELRRSQAQARQQSASLSQVIDDAPIGMTLTDLDGRWLRVNRAMCEIVGYREDELLGRSFRELTHPDDLDVDLAHVRRLLAGEISSFTLDKRYLHRAGHVIWIRLAVSLVRDEDGAPAYTIGQLADITAAKDAEAGLEAMVATRTRDLLAANQELESFSYSVSHDLRAPLRAIDGFSAALARSHADELSPDASHKLERIRAATQRMGQLIDELLELSRVTRRAMTVAPVDLTRMAHEIVEDLRARDPDRDVEVTVADGLTCHGDATLLRTLLENLLGNAWKFTARTADARIALVAADGPGGPAFAVRDNGAGFDMAHGDKLFRPFERLHRQDEFPGHGVGLSTVQRIVHRHGGTVAATGAIGAGAEITFSVPLEGTT